MFYIIEVDRYGNDQWIEWERYDLLPTASNRARVMLEDEPNMHGRIRVSGCVPVAAINERLGYVRS